MKSSDQTAMSPERVPPHELVRYSSQVPFSALREVLERFDFASPRVDIEHDGEYLLIQVDLPGISPDDIEVILDDYSLELEGERRDRRERRGDNVARSERGYGRFQRVIALPQRVDPESADAKFENGVLEIRVRALGASKPGRKLAITTGQPQSTKH